MNTFRKRRFGRRKVCRFCADTSLRIDYKDPRTLRLFTTERGKIIPGAPAAAAPSISAS